jgi:hypothetical protein
MSDSDPSPLEFALPRFIIGVFVNFSGIVIIEVVHFFVGMASFTDNVSDQLKAIDYCRWIWSPIAKLIYKNENFVLPPLMYVLSSVGFMGIAFIILGHFMLPRKRAQFLNK